jgi:oligopeptide transport system permease protein
MFGFVVRRILWLVPVLFVVSVITFTMMKAVPGGPWTSEKNTPPGVQEQLEKKYGTDQPVIVQYVRWLGGMLTLDFGPSYQYRDRTVNDIIEDGWPQTVQLGLMAFLLVVLVGVPLGVLAALGHNRWPDYLATTLSMVGIATPSFVLAILLIVIFSVGLDWFPARGWKGPETWVLPVISLAGYQIAQVARYTRASMLEVTRKDYVRTAHSKGVVVGAVVVRHMIRNALIPVITILGPILAFLITGSFIVESFFGVPGIGRNYIVAIGARDYSMIMATTVLYAFAVAFLNMVVDVLYAYIDPRIRYG